MRILTGIQPSGQLHIGNYFGAIEPAVRLQDQGEAFYFIADYHAMTTASDASELRENVRELAINFLACGMDPAKACVYRQSQIPEVHELAWILSSVCPMGLLERCHSFKEKTARGISANHGLLAYPVLMAADILMCDANLVPVGEDQKQHLEVARDLVGKINDKFGEGTLVLPEPQIRDEVAKVPGLDGEKMSKSYQNIIPVFGPQKKMRKLVMKIETDSTPVEEPKPTENSIILALYRFFASEGEQAQLKADFEAGGFGYGDLKQRLFDAYWDHFEPMRARREELEKDPGYVEKVLEEGAEKARSVAADVLVRVRKAVGLR